MIVYNLNILLHLNEYTVCFYQQFCFEFKTLEGKYLNTAILFSTETFLIDEEG